MKKAILLIIVLLTTSCGSLQVSTMNHDPIYVSTETEVNVINSNWELERLLRDDFQFRYNFAQYAMSQPIGFHFNNRMLRNTLGFNRFYRGYGYTSFTNRHQMWNDWVWGYPYGNTMGWSYSWNNNRWSNRSWSNRSWNGFSVDHFGGYWNNGWSVRWNGRYTSTSNTRRVSTSTSTRRVKSHRTYTPIRNTNTRRNSNIRRSVKPNRVVKPNKRTISPTRRVNNTPTRRVKNTPVRRVNRTSTRRVVNNRRNN